MYDNRMLYLAAIPCSLKMVRESRRQKWNDIVIVRSNERSDALNVCSCKRAFDDVSRTPGVLGLLKHGFVVVKKAVSVCQTLLKRGST